MKVASIQMVSGIETAPNLQTAGSLLDDAAGLGSELALLPEYFCILGAKDTDKVKIKETFGSGPIQDMLAQKAAHHKMWIVGGTLPLALEGDHNKVNNTTLVFDPSGNCVARYDKIHLFKFNNENEDYDESRTLVPGTLPVVFDLPSKDGHTWRVGLSICYDLRFPELYRVLTDLGAEMVLVPSAFTFTTGQAHWEVLLRARAIENQLWVVAAAQGGLHENNRKTWGHSMIINPWGKIIAERESGEGCVVQDISWTENVLARSQLPALEHRIF